MAVTQIDKNQINVLSIISGDTGNSLCEGSDGGLFTTSGSSSDKTVWNETPTGNLNGSNTTFTLTNTPVSIDKTMVFFNGVKLKKATDYTLSGDVITFVTYTPVSTDNIEVTYEKV